MSGKDPTEKLERKAYEKELKKLQEELCYLQDWVRTSGERVIVVLEGRAAGEALGKKLAPVDAAIVGIVDQLEFVE